MTKTYQAIDVCTGWNVHCVETGETVAIVQTKAEAITLCGALQRSAIQQEFGKRFHNIDPMSEGYLTRSYGF